MVLAVRGAPQVQGGARLTPARLAFTLPPMPHTLLLADDSVTIQRVIELTFADEDVTVVAVGDGDAAITQLEADPPPDIVLADVGMPGRDGYEVAAYVRGTPRLRHIPVVLLTGAFEPVDEARARNAGSAGVLVKPFEPQMVIERVRELLGTGGAGAGREEPDAADALLAAPPAQPPRTGGAASIDDYFDRLDAAFATLNVPLEPAVRQPLRDAPAPEPPATRPPPAAFAPVPPRAGFTMADAFGALLGAEQGEPAPALPEDWQPAISDDLVEEVARRVVDQVADRVVRELAPDIVSRVAERLVREEIERLRAAAHTP
jgi:CheY-like chemotaxis protein